MKTDKIKTPTLEIYLFGAPEIRQEGKRIDGLSAKSQALLFYLAMTQQMQMRSTLATLLWGDMAETRARANLRKTLQQLRENVGEHLTIDRHTVTLVKNNCWIDAVEFSASTVADDAIVESEEIRQSIELYRGDFLTGFHVRNTPDFEFWMSAEQARLREANLQKLETLVTRYIAESDLTGAINMSRRMIEMDPWREDVHYRLIELLAHKGEIGAALVQFENARKVLWDELGIDPDPAMVELVATLQSKQSKRHTFSPSTISPSTITDSRRLPSHTAMHAVAPRQQLTTVDYPLVGREEEWQSLSSAWRGLHHPRLVCIGGEAGIGKTRLAEELFMLAERDGQQTARTRCHALEGQLAYSPVVDWLRTPTLKSHLDQLEQTWLTEVARLVPELLHEYPDLPRPQPFTENWQRKHFFDALVRAFTVRQEPLLLFADDLQWCDGDTLEWLHYLLGSVDQPLLVLGTVRTDEIYKDHPLHRIQQQLQRRGKFTEIQLDPLEQQAVSDLAEQVAEQGLFDAQTETLFHDTAGNPLFVIESVRAAQNDTAIVVSTVAHDSEEGLDHSHVSIPPKMYSVIQSRLAQLSPDAQQLAQCGATIGRAFDVGLLVQAAALDEEPVLHALDELWQRRLIRPIDVIRFDFSHDRIRDVAYAEISPVTRPVLHRKVATALLDVYAGDLESVSGELAAHCERAGLFAEAVDYYRKTADAARQIFAHERAFNNRQKALNLLEQLPTSTKNRQIGIDLLLELFEDQIRIGGLGNPEGGKILHRAHDLASQVGTTTQKIEALNHLARFYRTAGNWCESQRFAQLAIALAEECADRELEWHAKYNIAHNLIHLGKLEEANLIYEETMFEVDGKMLHYAAYGHCLWLLGYPDQARQRGYDILQNARRTRVSVPVNLNLYAMNLAFCRDLPAMEALVPEQIEVTTKQGDQFFLRCARIYEGWLLAHRGRRQEGVALIRESTDEHRLRGNRVFDLFWRSLLVEAYLLASDPESALAETNELLALANKNGNCYWNAQLLKLRGDSLAAIGFPDEAIEACYQQAIATAQRQKGRSLELRATISLARLWWQQGRVDEAYQRLSEIYGWFTEGFDTADLMEAQAMLEKLRGPATIQRAGDQRRSQLSYSQNGRSRGNGDSPAAGEKER